MYIYVGPSWSSTAAAAGWTRDARRRQCELEKTSAEISIFWPQSIGERNPPWSRIQQQSLCIQRFARERLSKCGRLVVIIASWPWFISDEDGKFLRSTKKYNYQELLHQYASSPSRLSSLQAVINFLSRIYFRNDKDVFSTRLKLKENSLSSHVSRWIYCYKFLFL